ncbi:ABC transporter G family member 20-like [Solenopsis invicta]|uniref:ABC transporter G family member 20-like n=1 Tax=Solenopsis invicta TaxID=13686 RepID=UPI00193D4C46|nr:ABC transporter G family member 20-like [Solenopsis invicta]
MVQQEAVVVRNAMKRYEKEQLVLNNLNITVSRGSIYGLLGSSGCGKTTLFSCIVGLQYFNSGEVWVLGETPGSKGSCVPGPRVGYMPQDISLAGEFSISDAFYYFGRINGLEDEEIGAKQTFFSEFLKLPPLDRLVKNMSGGEQRRLSFACAVIHNPELLILDEPTVGLDPLLRESIWTYMMKLTKEEGVTVLITTHYIEETKDANKIGLMRKGKLLTESAPNELRRQYSSLEKAFEVLSVTQDKEDKEDKEITLNERYRRLPEATSSNVLSHDKYEPTKVISENKAISGSQVSKLKRFKALIAKNHIECIRNYSGLIFHYFFLLILSIAFSFAVGGDLKGIKIGLINEEADNCDLGSNIGNVWNNKSICIFNNLSCRFLYHFNDSIAIKEYYHDSSEAKRDVQNGKLCGIMHFNQNFSKGLQNRIQYQFYTSDSDLNASEITINLDMSDTQTGLFIQRKLSKRFMEVLQDIMRDCKYSIKLVDLPIKFEDPIYGKSDYNYKDFAIPSAILAFIFYLSVTNSTDLIIADRSDGLWNRSAVQGVRTEEILLSHILYQSLNALIDTILLILIFFVLLSTDYNGSIFLIFFVVFLSGFCGLILGLFNSVWYKNHAVAHFFLAGSFLLLLIVSGTMWPLEGVQKYLCWFMYAMPISLPFVSMRGLIYKGSSIFKWEVLSGIFTSLTWISFILLVTILYLRRKI